MSVTVPVIAGSEYILGFIGAIALLVAIKWLIGVIL